MIVVGREGRRMHFRTDARGEREGPVYVPDQLTVAALVQACDFEERCGDPANDWAWEPPACA